MSQPIRAKASGCCTDSAIGRAIPAKGGGSPGQGGRCLALELRRSGDSLALEPSASDANASEGRCKSSQGTFQGTRWGFG